MTDRDAQRVLAQRLRAEALFGVDVVPLPAPIEPMEDHPAAPATPNQPAAPVRPPAPTRPPSRPLASTPSVRPSAAPSGAADALFPSGVDDDLAGQTLGVEDKRRLLDELNQSQVAGCTKCGLCQARTQTVFGEGDPDARLMFIGEGPGQTEDQTGRPFVGRAGELLDKQIEAMGLKREQVYIANVVKCRPPNNRTPTPEEVATCGPYLVRQVRIIRPEVIVTLGGPASKMVLSTTEGITRLRGRWGVFGVTDPPVPVMPTFHPAFLLRAYTRDNRMKVWSDLQGVMEKLGIQPGG